MSLAQPEAWDTAMNKTHMISALRGITHFNREMCSKSGNKHKLQLEEKRVQAYRIKLEGCHTVSYAIAYYVESKKRRPMDLSTQLK